MHYICTVWIHSDQIMHCQLVFYVQTSQIMHICTSQKIAGGAFDEDDDKDGGASDEDDKITQAGDLGRMAEIDEALDVKDLGWEAIDTCKVWSAR